MSKHTKNFIGAVFNNPDDAQTQVEAMILQDFPMDQISILYHAGGQGDDFLGIAYTNEKERFKVWGTKGALWGSLAGLVAGATGLFLLPGIGPVFIAGPLIDIIVGAATGAGLMSAGVAATHLSIALRRLGIPEDKLAILHQAIMDDKIVLLMHCGNDDPAIWQQRLLWTGADPVLIMP
ncbi:MAG: hypothetical protein COA54_06000 [Thiotrichaceae bacterium]|nr:MAG: hypothetical protein COA54_06000 [Thiotrichaceae bacterium]